MSNTSLPLEQLPLPKQLYGRAGFARVNGGVGQMPGVGESMPAERSERGGRAHSDPQGQSVCPPVGCNYPCL